MLLITYLLNMEVCILIVNNIFVTFYYGIINSLSNY